MKTAIDLQNAITSNFQAIHEECLIEIARLKALIEEENNQGNIDVMYSKVTALRAYCNHLYNCSIMRIN